MTMPASRLSLDDATCPICLDILVDPVTPPCGHSLCGPCFEQTVQSSNLTCPLCRRRLSVWLRRARHSGSVLDSELWRSICRRFPERVLRRLDGAGDTDSPPESPGARSVHALSQPGEIGAEFEQCLQQLSAAELESRRQEEQLSERYIEQLLREERALQAAQELNDRLVAEQLQLAAAPPIPRPLEAATSSVDVRFSCLVQSVDGAVGLQSVDEGVSLQSVDEAVSLQSVDEAVSSQSVDEAVNLRSVDQRTCLQQAVCTPVTKRKSNTQRSVDCSTVSDTPTNCFLGVDSTSSRKRCRVSGGMPACGSGTSGHKKRGRTSAVSATGSCKENSNPVRLEESLRAGHVASSPKPASASTSGSVFPKMSSSVGIDSDYPFDLNRSGGGCASSPQLLAEQRAIEQRIQQELADMRMAKRLQKQLNGGSDRSWGGDNEYGLRSHRRP